MGFKMYDYVAPIIKVSSRKSCSGKTKIHTIFEDSVQNLIRSTSFICLNVPSEIIIIIIIESYRKMCLYHLIKHALANTPNQAETLLHSLERAAAGIGLHVNALKTEYMCYNQTGNIATLDGASPKLVDKFT